MSFVILKSRSSITPAPPFIMTSVPISAAPTITITIPIPAVPVVVAVPAVPPRRSLSLRPVAAYQFIR